MEASMLAFRLVKMEHGYVRRDIIPSYKVQLPRQIESSKSPGISYVKAPINT